MRVQRLQGIAQADRATGSVVVIDVLRAFTTAAWAFERGAREIRLVAGVDQAFAERARDPSVLLVGEVDGRPIEGFDLGNSPEAIAKLDLRDRAIVLRSSSGTQGVAGAVHASRIFLGSFVVARATARALRELGDDVALLAMGWSGNGIGPEDDACGDYLEAALLGREPELARCVRTARESPAAAQALDPRCDWITPGDLALALEVDRFDFAMRVERTGGGFARATRIDLRA